MSNLGTTNTGVRHPADHPMVRSFQLSDQPAVNELYTTGLLIGEIAANDTGADIEDIKAAYLANRRTHFWVAEVNGQVLGMIAVGQDDNHTAEIRRLRVARDHQHNQTIAARLIETALQHCRYHGYIKVILDTRYERSATMDVFTRFGFQHTRTKTYQGRDALEFYLDIYRPRKNTE